MNTRPQAGTEDPDGSGYTERKFVVEDGRPGAVV